METLHFEFVATEPPVKSIGRMCWLGRFRNFDGTRRNRKSFYSGSNFGRRQCGALAQSFERILLRKYRQRSILIFMTLVQLLVLFAYVWNKH